MDRHGRHHRKLCAFGATVRLRLFHAVIVRMAGIVYRRHCTCFGIVVALEYPPLCFLLYHVR